MIDSFTNLDFLISYLDDILIFSESETEHVKLFFKSLCKYIFNINRLRTLYDQQTIEFFGYEMSESGIRLLGK